MAALGLTRQVVLASLACGSLFIWSGAIGYAVPDDGDASIEHRVRMLSLELRCLVCQNETLADSPADLAVDLRREIHEQMEAGRTDEQIVAFLTERYGDFVRYRPPLKPTTYALWFGPFLLLGSGLLALYLQLVRRGTPSDALPVSSDERRRARRLLEGESR
jgi:cytochrome c-type biogenesis protein CcmH